MSSLNSKNKITPKHVAIIPDGNRRWAKERNLEPWEGHDAGAKNIEALVRKAFDLGVQCMSLWGSSLENLKKRPLIEKQELLRVYETYFKKLMTSEDIHKNEARIRIIGRWETELPASLVDILKDGIEKTKNYSKKSLNFFLAYSGDDEMVEAIRSIMKSGVAPVDVTKDTVKNSLWTHDLPSVDYMIRTGGDPHLSVGFMMWETANAELYFSEKLFPDFGERELEEALEEYSERARRMGK